MAGGRPLGAHHGGEALPHLLDVVQPGFLPGHTETHITTPDTKPAFMPLLTSWPTRAKVCVVMAAVVGGVVSR